MDEQGRQRVVLKKTRRSQSKEQKAGFVLISITGGLAILLGSFYLARHVSQPFDLEYSGPQFLTSAQREAQEVEEQKTLDTDRDGISDYDELYVLRTSPYLFDTDGDGLSDWEELQNNTDPTCATGADCSTSTFVNPLAEGESASFGFTQSLDPTYLGENPVPTPDQLLSEISNLNADQVRELLVASGADEAQLSQLSDEELLLLYQAALSDLESSGELESLAQQAEQVSGADADPEEETADPSTQE